jgi:hypothetical protein
MSRWRGGSSVRALCPCYKPGVDREEVEKSSIGPTTTAMDGAGKSETRRMPTRQFG